MKNYEVTVSLECTYVVAAVNEEMACDIANDYFCEAIPNFEVKKIDIGSEV